MRLPDLTALKTRASRAALAFDAWVNTSLFESSRSAAESYERFQERMTIFSFRGWKRFVLDLTSEGVTLGTAGAALMLLLAQPAFDLTSENWLKQQDFAVTFLDRYGNEAGRRGIKHDDSLTLDEFPDLMIKALLSTEDRRFYEHWGIDPIGLARALVSNSKGGGTQGGSTLTQQLAKNLFLTNERSIERKINEAFLSLWLETHQTKNEILKLYLDRAYMGGGTFGAVAAADYYFGKKLQDVTLAEAAMLSGLFKAPTKYSPYVNLPAARARAVDVLHNMVEAGFATEGQIQTALRNPATPVSRAKDEIKAEYYLDWAFAEIKKLAAEGRLRNDRVLVVKTPLDLGIQKIADQAVQSLLKRYGNTYDADEAGVAILDFDGAARALVGGADYGESQFNRATDALRQPGSSFKPYVYAAALSAGLYRPDSTVVDSPVCLGNWCPQNYGRSFSGRQPLWLAVAKSVNTIPVKISIALGRATGIKHDWQGAIAGRKQIIGLARAMGVESTMTDSVSLPIGAADITVLDQASGFATFANGGRRARAYATLEVRNSAGETLYRRAEEEQPQVLSSQVVADMNYMLRKVVDEGTARRAQIEGVPVAGKTGTTNGYRDAWFVGYSGNYVGAVWVGNDDHSPTNKMTGGSLPAMIWHEIMDPIHRGIAIRQLPTTSDKRKPAEVARAGEPSPFTPAASATGALSRRSFEVLSGLNGLFRSVETSVSAARNAPGKSGALDPRTRPPGLVPVDVAESGRAALP